MVVLSHPTGNTFVRAAARALHASGLLHVFHTTVVAPHERALSALPSMLRRRLARRRFDGIPRELIATYPWREAARQVASILRVRHQLGSDAPAGVDSVYESFDRHVSRHVGRLPERTPVSSVYCYEDAAEHTFRMAHTRGLACVYELPIAYWQTTQQLLHEEADRWPAWRATLYGIDDSREKLDRKVRELELATTVVVPSRFVLQSLPRDVRAQKRCILAPFGSPAPAPESAEPTCQAGRLRILFVGAMTQRKGLADLFAAMRLLNRPDVELVVMGTPLMAVSFYRSHNVEFIYEPPRPHDDVLALMRTCDVLVLPSVVEGRALVQQEALASGLPLLVTPNAGGDDLVDEGQTGFLVPIRDPEALADRIAWFADHRADLPAMRRFARRKAADTSWTQYEAHVREAVTQ